MQFSTHDLLGEVAPRSNYNEDSGSAEPQHCESLKVRSVSGEVQAAAVEAVPGEK